MNTTDNVDAAVREIITMTRNRHAVLIFGASVDHAMRIKDTIASTKTMKSDQNFTIFSNGGLPFLRGFSIEFIFTFEVDGKKIRGDEHGYVQAEIKRNGEYRSKLSFVGNSGIKIGGPKGTEIVILDVVGMVSMIGGLEAFKSAITLNAQNIPVVKYGIYEQEELSRLMSGIKYGLNGADYGKIYQINGNDQLRAFSAVNPTIDDYRNLFAYNYE